MGRLTTHVLDTTNGRPGNGIVVSLYRLDDEQRSFIKRTVTNDDGRCDEPVLEGADFSRGVYELVFSAGAYFAAMEEVSASRPASPQPPFLDEVVIRFGVASPDQHYHVPLLISPYSYSTYRGS